MKTIKYIIQLMLVSFVVFATSCARDYEQPDVEQYKPYYSPDYNKFTKIDLKDFKAKYANLADEASVRIEEDLMIEAVVTGNDISGNIFKQLYIQDQMGNTDSRGLYMGVDQNEVSKTYGVGQKIYIELRGLYAVRYGEQLQIGFGTTQANRIPWETFKSQVHRHEWANPKSVAPLKVKISELTDDMANTLVQFDGVEFVNAGTGKFIEPGNQYTEQQFTEASTGRQIIIRTSEYFKSLKDKPLPTGRGTLVGILGKHRTTWQLVLRDTGDIRFDGSGSGPVTPTAKVFHETFGNKGGDRLKVDAYTDWAMKAPVKYSDRTGRSDIRALGGDSHLWMPKAFDDNPDAYLTIEGIDTKNMKEPVLTFRMAASVFDPGVTINLNVIKITAGDKTLEIPSKVVSADAGDANKFYDIKIKDFPIGDNIKLEFKSDVENTVGIRLDDIRIADAVPEDDGSTVITPNN